MHAAVLTISIYVLVSVDVVVSGRVVYRTNR